MSQMAAVDKIAAGENLLKKCDVFHAKQECFWNFHVFLKKIGAKETFPDNPQQNICDLSIFQYSLHMLQVKQC